MVYIQKETLYTIGGFLTSIINQTSHNVYKRSNGYNSTKDRNY